MQVGGEMAARRYEASRPLSCCRPREAFMRWLIMTASILLEWLFSPDPKK
jgi:hypothetical protein